MKPNSLKYCCQITCIHKVKALIFPFYRGEASGIGCPHSPADHRPQYPLHPPRPVGDQGGGGYEVLQRPDELCPPGELQHPPDDALHSGTGSYTLLYIYSYPQNYMCAIIICEIGDQHKFWNIYCMCSCWFHVNMNRKNTYVEKLLWVSLQPAIHEIEFKKCILRLYCISIQVELHLIWMP